MAKVSVIFHAPIEKVWDALIRPELIKKWLFGTNNETDWKPEARFLWRGVWEAKEYEDEGKVLEIRRPERISYTRWSTFSGKPDLPENYVTVVCDLRTDRENTVLTISRNCSGRRAAGLRNELEKSLRRSKEAIRLGLNRAGLYCDAARDKPETREKRMKVILGMLAHGQKFHP